MGAYEESGPRRNPQIRNDTLNVSSDHIEANPVQSDCPSGFDSIGNPNCEDSRGQIGFLKRYSPGTNKRSRQ